MTLDSNGEVVFNKSMETNERKPEMTTANAAIAAHLNILESAIKEVQEWASVLFVKFVSGRPRFVSKKVAKQETKEMKSRTLVTGKYLLSRFVETWNATHGSEWNRLSGGFMKATLWDKKEGELRVYFSAIKGEFIRLQQKGHEFMLNSIPTKYGIDQRIRPILVELSQQYKVTSLDKVLMQEDEDGVIAPEGHHEAGVHIVREWWS